MNTVLLFYSVNCVLAESGKKLKQDFVLTILIEETFTIRECKRRDNIKMYLRDTEIYLSLDTENVRSLMFCLQCAQFTLASRRIVTTAICERVLSLSK